MESTHTLNRYLSIKYYFMKCLEEIRKCYIYYYNKYKAGQLEDMEEGYIGKNPIIFL